MPHKIVKIIDLVLIAATVGALFVFSRPVLAGDEDPHEEKDPKCGPERFAYGIYGTQDAAGAYIGSATLYISTNCPSVCTLNFIIDGQRYVNPDDTDEYYFTLYGGTHTVVFFFDTGAGGRWYPPGGQWGNDAYIIAINTYRSPTIDGVVTCDARGQNGWCVGNETLSLTASDPQGQTVQVSWDVAGYPYVRSDGQTSFDVSLPNGSGAINYLVRSATTLTASGSKSWALDNVSPQINDSLTGIKGSSDWFVSNAVMSASAADATSGLSVFDYSLDNAGYIPYSVPLTLTDGAHTLILHAVDLAGNENITTQSINVDTITPVMDISLSGASGSNDWYTSNVQAAIAASDSGSGLSSLEYALDGGTWTGYNGAPVASTSLNAELSDGIHSLSVRATDAAGNDVTQSDQQIKVDATRPLINLSVNGTPGAGGWHISNIQVVGVGSDSGSGLSSFEYSLDNGAWTSYVNPLPYAQGQYRLAFRAIDMAGNETITPAQNLWVDTTPPEIQMPDTLKPGETEYYKVSDAGSGVGGVRVVIQDGQERYPKVTWGDGELAASFTGEIYWDGRFADGTVAPAGDYFVTVKAHDQAGNESEETAIITVENSLFTYLIPRYVPPAIAAPVLPILPVLPSTDSNFGGGTVIAPAVPQSDTLTTGPVTESQPANLPSTNFPTTNIPSTSSGLVLWGAIAAAALGAVAAETIQKKSFGGETNQGTSTQTSTFTSGGTTASASALSVVEVFSAPSITNIPTTNTQTTPGILGGANAVAAIGAFLADAIAERRRKHEEELEAQAAERKRLADEAEAAEAAKAARHAARAAGDDDGGGPMTYAQIGKAYQASLNKFKADLIKDGLTETQASAFKSEAIKNGSIASVAGATQDAVDKNEKEREEQRQRLIAMNEDRAPIDMDKVNQLVAEANAQQALEDFRAGEQQVYNVMPPKKETNWLSNIPFVGTQLATAWQNSSLKQVWDEKVYEPIIEPVVQTVTLKNVVPALLTIALGANGVQWVSNVVSNPNLFLPIQSRAELLIEELYTKHPTAPETKTFDYLLSHPYDVIATGADYLNTITSIGASYADAIWQQNPLVQVQIEALEILENSGCSSISSRAWANRCTGAFYLPAGLMATPFDTGLGVANAFVVDPVEGILKQGALIREDILDSFGIVNAIRDGGLEGGLDFLKDLAQRNLQILLNDKQLQSAIFLEILVAAAILAAPVAGSVILGATAKSLIDLDAAVASATDKKKLIELVTSHGVRTTVVSSIIIFALMAAGLSGKASEFRAYQESLSPSGQAALAELSLLEQTQIVDLAAKAKLSPGALEFYLNEVGRPGSPFAELSMTDGLRLSVLKTTPDTSAIKYIYDVRTSQYRYISTGRFVSPRDLPWPSNNGFAEGPINTTLVEGTLIDRYGKLTGQYAGEPGTSISARGMAIGSENMSYTNLKVIKTITVTSGPAAAVPEFGAIGGGIQYYFKGGLQSWIDSGYLEVLP